MAYDQVINLDYVDLEFNIEACRNNEYSLSVLVNGVNKMIDKFKDLDDVHTAFLNILDDFDNGMIELYCRRSR